MLFSLVWSYLQAIYYSTVCVWFGAVRKPSQVVVFLSGFVLLGSRSVAMIFSDLVVYSSLMYYCKVLSLVQSIGYVLIVSDDAQ